MTNDATGRRDGCRLRTTDNSEYEAWHGQWFLIFGLAPDGRKVNYPGPPRPPYPFGVYHD